MHSELDELRPKLKEILYDCAVEIRATKAALYLFDLASKRYELTIEYGFRSKVRQTAGLNDPMVDRCARGRLPFYVNNPAADPRLSELLFEASTERLMGVPLFSRGQLIGFIDMRDKAQRQPFDQLDVSKAQSVADRILEMFSSRNLWNQRFITLAEAPKSGTAQGPPSPPAVPSSRPVPEEGSRTTGLNPTIVEQARPVASRLASPAPSPKFGPAERAAVSDLLRAVLLLPGAVAVAFCATEPSGGVQEIASLGIMTDEAVTTLQLKLRAWLGRRGRSVGELRTNLHNPHGLTLQPITGTQLQRLFTAPVMAGKYEGLYLTVAFSDSPPQAVHELLAALLQQMQTIIEGSIAAATLLSTRLRMAEWLVEPDYSAYPALRGLTRNVVEVVDAFCRHLGWAGSDLDTARLAAMVHDSGMRLLDYDGLYRKRDLSQDELAMLREHAAVGAALVEPLLGGEVARAVLCHHERIDGMGYPNALRGEEIPLTSRILQICDAYVAITEAGSYQVAESPASALEAIGRGAGKQFDADLARRFEEMMRSHAQSTRLAGP